MHRIIGFAAPAGGGKDTAGHHLVNRYGFTRLSFATPMYKALEAMGFGWPQNIAEKEEIIPDVGVTWRHLAQTLGTEWGRMQVHPDLWRILAQRVLDTHPESQFVLTDVRFENEADFVRANDGLIVHIQGRSLGTGNDKHASEQRLKVQEGDSVLVNDKTIESLHTAIDWMLA